MPSPNATLMLRPSGNATLMLEGSPGASSGWVRDLNTAAHLRSSASAASNLPAPEGGEPGGKTTTDVSAIAAQAASARREYRMVRTIRQPTNARYHSLELGGRIAGAVHMRACAITCCVSQ